MVWPASGVAVASCLMFGYRVWPAIFIGAAIVNAVGPIRQIVQNSVRAERRYLVIAPGEPAKFGDAVQVQTP